MLCLFALHHVPDHDAGQQRIFAGVFERATIPGLTSEVHAAPESHVEALRSKLATNDLAICAS